MPECVMLAVLAELGPVLVLVPGAEEDLAPRVQVGLVRAQAGLVLVLGHCSLMLVLESEVLLISSFSNAFSLGELLLMLLNHSILFRDCARQFRNFRGRDSLNSGMLLLQVLMLGRNRSIPNLLLVESCLALTNSPLVHFFL